MERTPITKDVIERFIQGYDPEERIVGLDCNYNDDFITVISRDINDKKVKIKHSYYPFLWATRDACLKLGNGDRKKVKELLSKYGIKCIALDCTNNKGETVSSVKDGYAYMFKATRPLSHKQFLEFFNEAGNPVYSDNGTDTDDDSNETDSRQYLMPTQQEQFLISTGKRFFKGYSDYDQLLRCLFDLETEGLDPTRHRIISLGVRFNRPVTYKGVTKEFNKIIELQGETKEEKDKSELRIICFLLSCIKTFEPDVIGGHNTENFDWLFIIERCHQIGVKWKDLSEKYLGEGNSIYKKKKETVLKLGGEIEHFFQTVVPYTTVVDSLHAVRRAQATDSNFKEANLKYATRYLHLVKSNRVYVPGNKISEISADEVERYAFNETNGHWYIYDPNTTDNGSEIKVEVGKEFKISYRNRVEDGYRLVSGHYIIEQYLLDDIYEADKVEYTLNGTDFMLCKIVPTVFQKAITMGTAGQWKLIMMAWSYENNLAIPKPKDSGKFTGGLSRLLSTGYVKDVVKLDYNSLYPSIILTWAISDETDLMQGMLKMLEYVLTTRETHKKLKKEAEKKKDAYEERMNGESLSDEDLNSYNEACKTFKAEDNNQLVVKKLGNSFFGSYGSNNGSVFPWKSVVCAERTTCTGRQALRLMISHFSKLGYTPVVGDSFTADTPVFIKYDDTESIDIVPISELINENEIKIDDFGREYDYSDKPYKVLCRSGWVKPSYIYRHKTDKDIYEVTDGDTRIDVTEDHSLFNSKQEKIKPSEIDENTELEYYNGPINYVCVYRFMEDQLPYIKSTATALANGKIDRVPKKVLNYSPKLMKLFYYEFMRNWKEDFDYSKTCLAGLHFLKERMER